MTDMSYIFLVLALILNAIANISIKKAAISSGASISSVLSNPFVYLGIFMFALNLLLYYLALRSLPISVAYPIMVGAGFLLINGYASFFLNETVSGFHIVGYVLIITGLVFVTR